MSEERSILLFGSRGQLGSSLLQALPKSREVISIHWSGDPGFLGQVRNRVKQGGRLDLVFAGGLTNPALPESELLFSNFEFPKQVAEEAMEGSSGTRFLTFGTVMEYFPKACESNPYLRSKARLGAWVEEAAKKYSSRAKHVRLHTLYGGDSESFLKPHMFLGQIYQALKKNTEFRMSAGTQMREYHHAEDIGAALCRILENSWEGQEPVLLLSSGEPVRLADLARAIFQGFGKENLLKVGAIASQQGENFDRVFPRTEERLLPRARSSIEGVLQWLRNYLD